MTGWRWSFLVKTKVPQLVDQPWEVSEKDRETDLARLQSIVNPTVKQMQDVLAGNMFPVPTQAYGRFCGGCPYRRNCIESHAVREPAASGGR